MVCQNLERSQEDASQEAVKSGELLIGASTIILSYSHIQLHIFSTLSFIVQLIAQAKDPLYTCWKNLLNIAENFCPCTVLHCTYIYARLVMAEDAFICALMIHSFNFQQLEILP